MKNLRLVVIGSLMLACTSMASAQSSSASSSTTSDRDAQSTKDTTSKDPFVQRREEKKAAKKQYKSKSIDKSEYKAQKKTANDKLRATGERSDQEKNLELQPTGK